ncbi:unnamed protein product [Camellia sinensis]
MSSCLRPKCGKTQNPNFQKTKANLSGENNGTTSLFDLLLSSLRNNLSLDNDRHRLRQYALTKNLEVTKLSDIDHRSIGWGSLGLDFLRNERPQLVDVDDGAIELVAEPVEVPHPDFAEVTWMVLVEEDAVVVHSSGVSSPAGMFSVFSNAAVAGADVAPLLPVLLQPCRHCCSLSLSLSHTLGVEV